LERLKTQDRNTQDRKMQEQMSGVENVGSKFVGPNAQDGKCGTEKTWDRKV